MSKLICKPCLVFDALAALVFCNNDCRNDVPKAKEWVEKTFQGVSIGASDQFFKILSTHHSFEEIESFSIEKLAEVYPLYIDDFSYAKRYEVDLKKGLQILKNSAFEELWRTDILPILNCQCDEALSNFNDERINAILSDISHVRQNKMDDDIYIIMTYFTYGIHFQIAPNSYITNATIGSPIDIERFLQLFAHELCHGFSNEKARTVYINACKQDAYLNKVNWFFNEFNAKPGNEEEFVQAVDRIISVKHGLTSYDDVIKNFNHSYKCSTPIAVILFSELCKLQELPADMNEWICEKFTDNTIKINDIESKVNSIIPGYSDRFGEIWREEEQKNPERFVNYIPI